MSISAPAAGLDDTSRRVDQCAAELAVAAVDLRPETLDATIDATLRRAGEALGAEHLSLTCLADEGTPALRYVWRRAGAGFDGSSALAVRVPVAGAKPFALTVGLPEGGLQWPPAVADSLRVLAHFIVVVLQRDEHMREVQRARLEASRSSPPPPHAFDSCWNDEGFDDIIGDCPALRVAVARLNEVAPSDASVVLLGETGTGKELFARAVHHRSPRRNGPFVKVACATLPPALIESELFGHVRGAFTGAVSARQGRFELADGGTLFLDEVDDLPPEVQGKLLRVLQEGEFERVGSSQTRKVDVRIVAASQYELAAAVQSGHLRPDLFYRLNVFPIVLPPLRERLEDIPRLVWYFVNRRQRALRRRFTAIPDSVFADLQQRAWPGNVRELRNVIERAMIHSPAATLQLDDVAEHASTPAYPEGVTLDVLERQYVEEALRRCRWRINGRGNAAEILGLHPNTLRNRMRKFGIRRPSEAGALRDGRRSA